MNEWTNEIILKNVYILFCMNMHLHFGFRCVQQICSSVRHTLERACYAKDTVNTEFPSDTDKWFTLIERRWPCNFPLFASCVNWMKASLPHNAMVWLRRLSHLMSDDHFLSRTLNDTALATSTCDPEDHISAYWTGINGYFGKYLAMVRQDMQDMLLRCHLCVEMRVGYVEDVGA